MKIGKMNYGIALLKAFMCYCVVCCHFLSDELLVNCKEIIFITRSAVPVFMLISFYFYAGKAETGKKKDVLRRCIRLYKPQVIWGCIFFATFLFLNLTVNMGQKVYITDLLWQCVTGHSPRLNTAMWFQFVLIVFTIIIGWGGGKLCTNGKCILGIIIGYILIYSERSFKLFCNMPYELCYPLGRIVEMFPIVLVGVILARNNLLRKAEQNKLFAIAVGLVLIGTGYGVMLLELNIAYLQFGYGFMGLLIGAVGFVVFFYCLPFDAISDALKNVMGIATRYTMGIYCMHILVGRILVTVVEKLGFAINSFLLCGAIYVTSYIIASVMDATKIKLFSDIVN